MHRKSLRDPFSWAAVATALFTEGRVRKGTQQTGTGQDIASDGWKEGTGRFGKLGNFDVNVGVDVVTIRQGVVLLISDLVSD